MMSEHVKISVKIGDLEVAYEGNKENADELMEPFIEKAKSIVQGGNPISLPSTSKAVATEATTSPIEVRSVGQDDLPSIRILMKKLDGFKKMRGVNVAIAMAAILHITKGDDLFEFSTPDVRKEVQASKSFKESTNLIKGFIGNLTHSLRSIENKEIIMEVHGKGTYRIKDGMYQQALKFIESKGGESDENI